MRFKRLNLSALLLIVLGIQGLQAQETVVPSGGMASGSGGSVSYSIGQLVYQPQEGSSGSVAAGVQQPFEISVVSVAEEATNVSLAISAFPNPTSDFLRLDVEDFEASLTTYQLYNTKGVLLKNERLASKETRIDMRTLEQSTYLLNVVRNSKVIKTFKVIKK